MLEHKTIYINHNDSEKIEKWLHSKGQGEDYTYIQTAVFSNGFEADIKCCGCQDDVSWTEMVLFKDGNQVCYSKIHDKYFGDWKIEYFDTVYKVTVSKEPICWNCCYVGDNKSFPQPNDKVLRRYYCNCGDSKYYEQDITGKEIHKCEYFEEV